MARFERPDYSMFSATPAYSGINAVIDGVRQSVIVFGLLVPAVVPDASDVLYTVTQGETSRLDLISQRFYGTPELWWAVAVVNNMVDPLLGFASNQTIRMPTKNRLAAEGLLSV